MTWPFGHCQEAAVDHSLLPIMQFARRYYNPIGLEACGLYAVGVSHALVLYTRHLLNRVSLASPRLSTRQYMTGPLLQSQNLTGYRLVITVIWLSSDIFF